jgi:hypothetical protein
MASKDAAFAQSSTIDRMGALAKWIAAKAEEMAQLDRRIDRRLDHLQRSEDNLRALFEAIREQVTSAHSVSEELQKRTSTIDDHEQQLDAVLVQALERASRLSDAVDTKSRQLEQTAETIVQSTNDRLEELTEQAREAQAPMVAQIAQHVAQQSRFDNETTVVQIDFEQRTAEVVESIRRSAIEQIERLASQVAVAVDPVLSRVDAHRQRAEAQLNAAAGTAEEALRKRAEELCRTGDTVVDTVENRLARRLENVRPRAIETLETAERAMKQHLAALLDGARLSVAATEAELADRVAQFRPKLTQLLQTAQDDLVDQLSRLEEHAFAMTGWLEKRMTERVDALVSRTRAALSQTPSAPASPLSPEAVSLVCYAGEYPAPAAVNSVDVQVFLDRNGDRVRRSTPASIFK